MNDINWDKINTDKDCAADARREKADEDFDLAASLISNCPGVTLKKCSVNHYQVIRYHPDQDRRWILNIYPGNQRLYQDKNFAGRCFINCPAPWTLIDVSEAVMRHLCKETKR